LVEKKDDEKEDNGKKSVVRLEDYERRMVNMSALKSASSVFEGSGDPDRVINTAERFVDWILGFRPSGVVVGGEPATERQKEYLRQLGVSFDEGISKREASRLIDEKLREGK